MGNKAKESLRVNPTNMSITLPLIKAARSTWLEDLICCSNKKQEKGKGKGKKSLVQITNQNNLFDPLNYSHCETKI